MMYFRTTVYQFHISSLHDLHALAPCRGWFVGRITADDLQAYQDHVAKLHSNPHLDIGNQRLCPGLLGHVVHNPASILPWTFFFQHWYFGFSLQKSFLLVIRNCWKTWSVSVNTDQNQTAEIIYLFVLPKSLSSSTTCRRVFSPLYLSQIFKGPDPANTSFVHLSCLSFLRSFLQFFKTTDLLSPVQTDYIKVYKSFPWAEFGWT